MQGQTILITGATDGIGRGTAMELARRGATVLLHGRDAARLEAIRDEIAAATGAAPPETFLADFASLAEIRRLASEVGAAHPVLHVLINNAGIGRGPDGGRVREVSADGHELRFQVNHLAALLLSRLLLDNLRRAPPGRNQARTRAGRAFQTRSRCRCCKMFRVPCDCMASRALRIRFMITCSTWMGSTSTIPVLDWKDDVIAMRDPTRGLKPTRIDSNASWMLSGRTWWPCGH